MEITVRLPHTFPIGLKIKYGNKVIGVVKGYMSADNGYFHNIVEIKPKYEKLFLCLVSPVLSYSISNLEIRGKDA